MICEDDGVRSYFIRYQVAPVAGPRPQYALWAIFSTHR